MKKIFTLFAAAVLTAGIAFAGGSYGIAVNGATYYAGTENPSPGDPSFQEFMVLGLSLNAGDKLQLWDPSGYDGQGAGWAVPLDGASVASIQLEGNDHYVCNAAGCYDFYIKLKFEADQLYIGAGNCGTPTGTPINGGGGQGGGEGGEGGQGGGDASGYDFYVMGWIDGADAGETAYDLFDDKYKFVDGKITINCAMGSYIGVKDENVNYYYSRNATSINDNSVTLEWANGWSPCEKWAIPEGTNYIIIRSIEFKGNIVLERVDKATYDAYHLNNGDAVENVTVDANIIKTIENGQVVIIKNGVRYNLLGGQLQ